VVDDDPRVLTALAQLLAAHGVPAVAAADAATAVALAARGADVALVDTQLPTVGDGVALIGDLAARLPVVATSVDSALGPAALAAGATEFTEKDGQADALVHLLRRAARSAPSGTATTLRPSRPRPAAATDLSESHPEETAP
jgi:DNA-binding NtrC family response regulator